MQVLAAGDRQAAETRPRRFLQRQRLLVQAARALISLPARRSTCRTLWRAPLCQLIDGSSRQSASLKAARQQGYFRVARSENRL